MLQVDADVVEPHRAEQLGGERRTECAPPAEGGGSGCPMLAKKICHGGQSLRTPASSDRTGHGLRRCGRWCRGRFEHPFDQPGADLGRRLTRQPVRAHHALDDPLRVSVSDCHRPRPPATQPPRLRPHGQRAGARPPPTTSHHPRGLKRPPPAHSTRAASTRPNIASEARNRASGPRRRRRKRAARPLTARDRLQRRFFCQVFSNPRPRSSGDRASPSGGVCAGSNPAEGTIGVESHRATKRAR
jgi:hypothetical protein